MTARQYQNERSDKSRKWWEKFACQVEKKWKPGFKLMVAFLFILLLLLMLLLFFISAFSILAIELLLYILICRLSYFNSCKSLCLKSGLVKFSLSAWMVTDLNECVLVQLFTENKKEEREKPLEITAKVKRKLKITKKEKAHSFLLTTTRKKHC